MELSWLRRGLIYVDTLDPEKTPRNVRHFLRLFLSACASRVGYDVGSTCTGSFQFTRRARTLCTGGSAYRDFLSRYNLFNVRSFEREVAINFLRV